MFKQSCLVLLLSFTFWSFSKPLENLEIGTGPIVIRNHSEQDVTVRFGGKEFVIEKNKGLSVSQTLYNANPLPAQLPAGLTTIFEADGWCDIVPTR